MRSIGTSKGVTSALGTNSITDKRRTKKCLNQNRTVLETQIGLEIFLR